MRYGLFALLAACASPGRTVISVQALGASTPEADVTVVSHLASGVVLDTQTTDVDGQVALQSEAGGLVTVWFRWAALTAGIPDEMPGPVQPTFAVTTVAPADGRELVIHGPPDPLEPPIASLTVNAPAISGAFYYNVLTGCTGTSTQLPVTIDLAPECLGSDSTVDVVVSAIGSSPANGTATVIGYAASRIPVTGSTIQYDVTAWDTTAPVLPVQLNDIYAIVRVALRSDGLEVLDELAYSTGVTYPIELWLGVTLDGLTIRGFDPGRFVRDVVGVPDQVDISTDDVASFESIAASIVAGRALPTLKWPASPRGVELLYVSLAFDTYSWHLVMPPSAAEVSLPGVDGALVQRTSPGTSALDMPGASADDRAALELHLESPYPIKNRVVIPSSGEVRYADH